MIIRRQKGKEKNRVKGYNKIFSCQAYSLYVGHLYVCDASNLFKWQQIQIQDVDRGKAILTF